MFDLSIQSPMFLPFTASGFPAVRFFEILAIEVNAAEVWMFAWIICVFRNTVYVIMSCILCHCSLSQQKIRNAITYIYTYLQLSVGSTATSPVLSLVR